MRQIKLNYPAKLLLIIIFSLFSLLNLQAIDFISGPGHNISAGFNQERDREFYYHNYTDDQHWYGTNKWAVRFDFSEEYPTFSGSGFSISKVKIYFPILPDSVVTVKILNNDNNFPGSQVASLTTSVTSHWMEFDFTPTDSMSTAWVVLECNTGVNGPYVSASLGGGTHSYYWNTNSPVWYYQNLFTAGIHSEFLFSVVGRFVFDDFDLELSSFELKPVIAPGSNVAPEFSIINNSATQVDSAVISLAVTSPNPEFAFQDTIYVLRAILPYSVMFISYDDPDFANHAFRLPDYPTQLKVRAVLSSEYNSADTLFNNTITHYYNSFSRDLPVKPVENFIIYDSAQNLLQAQDNSTAGDFTALNYFPVAGTPFYTLEAAQRYDWYGLAGYPNVVVGGDSIITGYIPSAFPGFFDSAIQGISNQKTFIQFSNSSLSLPEPYNVLSARITLRNTETYVFNNGSDPTLMMQSRFFAALFKKVDLLGSQRYVFDRWGAYADTINTALVIDADWLKQFSVSVGNIGTDSLMTDYDIIFWIQHNTTKQIIFADLIHLNDVVSNPDDSAVEAPPNLVLAPNPLFLGSDLRLNINGSKINRLLYSIYNCKGQKVLSNEINPVKGEAVLNLDKITSSGVYLIRFESLSKSGLPSACLATKKIMIYK